MSQLIKLSDIQEFKGISSNINSVKDLIPHILEAQEFDLRPFMGESFYLDLLDDFDNSPSLNDYSVLFNGKRYTYNGEKYEFQGLKAVLIYHAYARYLSDGGSTSTPTGRVNKSNQYSEKVSDKTYTRLIQQARSGAMAHQERVLSYLNRNQSQYPLFKCSGGKKYKNGVIIKKIG